MIKHLIITLFCLLTLDIFAQTPYEKSAAELTAMLNGQTPLNFKKAVFSTENAYFDNQLSEKDFDKVITLLLKLVKSRAQTVQYTGKDSVVTKQHAAIFKTMMDTSLIVSPKDTFLFLPYRYDFDDMFGRIDWSTMFVTKLLATHKGNCHSMPYLYKILCQALSIPCYLSFAPNHIYIKNYSEQTGWYNTELTSASFPIDAWLMASGYIGLEAIQNGIYMDTINDKQAVALCMLDLGKSFDRKYPNNDGTFVVQCCDATLTHFPKCINALILKAETRKRQVVQKQKDTKSLTTEMNSLYTQIHQLGYRTMPQQMYLDWMQSLQRERAKYKNQQSIQVIKN